jgi:hypothetical protein
MQDLPSLFDGIASDLPATRTARSYVTGLFLNQARSTRAVDFSRRSLVLSYISQRDFAQSQDLADWVLWALSWVPTSVRDHRELAESLGRLSYYRCYRLVPSWRVYEELADNLPVYARHLSAKVSPLFSVRSEARQTDWVG